MIKIKTTVFLIIVLFLFNNCGYTPQYAKKDNLNFSIEIIGLSGDRDFNNAFKTKLSKYSVKKGFDEKIFKINVVSKYEKNTSLKDSSGTTTEYELNIKVGFKVTYENVEKNITIKDSFRMKKMSDSFEESNYEKIIKNNFAETIKEKLLFNLIRM
tara:strand:+ start:571 stop:1038 length:468 start_codon:yes stop_codon:yes gene_type:complete